MMSYATESQKGTFIGIFWAIFNLGAVVGSAVSLGQNFHSTVHKPNFISIILYLTYFLPPGQLCQEWHLCEYS